MRVPAQTLSPYPLPKAFAQLCPLSWAFDNIWVDYSRGLQARRGDWEPGFHLTWIQPALNIWTDVFNTGELFHTAPCILEPCWWVGQEGYRQVMMHAPFPEHWDMWLWGGNRIKKNRERGYKGGFHRADSGYEVVLICIRLLVRHTG